MDLDFLLSTFHPQGKHTLDYFLLQIISPLQNIFYQYYMGDEFLNFIINFD